MEDSSDEDDSVHVNNQYKLSEAAGSEAHSQKASVAAGDARAAVIDIPVREDDPSTVAADDALLAGVNPSQCNNASADGKVDDTLTKSPEQVAEDLKAQVCVSLGNLGLIQYEILVALHKPWWRIITLSQATASSRESLVHKCRNSVKHLIPTLASPGKCGVRRRPTGRSQGALHAGLESLAACCGCV
jgi:hypothetical protein